MPAVMAKILGTRVEENMAGDEQEDTTVYKVVVNQEGQYSIWATDRPIPLGWSEAGKDGSKAECLAYIEEVWTDMRPMSIRG
jgi:MbtH protein